MAEGEEFPNVGNLLAETKELLAGAMKGLVVMATNGTNGLVDTSVELVVATTDGTNELVETTEEPASPTDEFFDATEDFTDDADAEFVDEPLRS